jgi:hypothetical protein
LAKKKAQKDAIVQLCDIPLEELQGIKEVNVISGEELIEKYYDVIIQEDNAEPEE